MKILLTSLVVFMLSIAQSFAIINFTLKANTAFTGGDWEHTEEGHYTSHTIHDENGATITCRVTGGVCFEAKQNGQDIDITIYDLPGGGSGDINAFYISSDEETGEMTIENQGPSN